MKRIYIILIIIVILLIIGITIFNSHSFESRLIRYIKSKGFVQGIGDIYENKDNKNTCNKDTDDNCSNINYYFNIVDYKYIKKIVEKQDNVLFELSMTYGYKNQTINFNYRVSHENGTLIYKGNYSDEFECNLDFNHGIDIKDENEFCNYIFTEVNNFNSESQFFIQNTKYLNKMSE